VVLGKCTGEVFALEIMAPLVTSSLLLICLVGSEVEPWGFLSKSSTVKLDPGVDRVGVEMPGVYVEVLSSSESVSASLDDSGLIFP
jgi:hypothetical protein